MKAGGIIKSGEQGLLIRRRRKPSSREVTLARRNIVREELKQGRGMKKRVQGREMWMLITKQTPFSMVVQLAGERLLCADETL